MPRFSTTVLAGSAAVFLASLVAGAQAQTAPIPDFSSNGTAWQTANGTDFIQVPGSPQPTTNDPAHPYISNGIANRTGQQPTFRIADLSNSNVMPWAKEVMKRENEKVLAGGIAYTPGQACKPSGVPYYMLSGGPFYFVQTPKEVILVEEGERHARHIYMDVPHSANPKPTWYGESVGRYDGDTLVVDTVGMNDKTYIDGYRTPHTEKLHVVERWRMIDDGKTLEVHMTVEDPGTFYKPFEVMRRYGRVKATLGEEICQEGNFILFDYGIPVADKADF